MNANYLNLAAESWRHLVWHGAWQAAIVGALALTIVYFARNASAQFRYAILLLAVLKFAIPPVLPLTTSIFGILHLGPDQRAFVTKPDADNVGGSLLTKNTSAERITWRMTERESEHTVAVQKSVPAAATGGNLIAESGEARQRAIDSQLRNGAPIWSRVYSINMTSWLMVIHALGTFLFATYFFKRVCSLKKRHADMRLNPPDVLPLFQACAKQIGLKRIPALRVGESRYGAYSSGILQPTVVVPANHVETMSRESLEVVFFHELAHHRRRDLLVNGLQLVLMAVWWWHPVLWCLSVAIRREREDCCDDLLLARKIVRPDNYCSTLIKAASLCRISSSMGISPAVGMTRNGSPMARRFRRIMNADRIRFDRLSRTTLAAIILAAVFILPGTRRLVAQPQQAPSSEPDSKETESNLKKENPDKQPGQMQVKVVDEHGQPVSGAKVLLETRQAWTFKPFTEQMTSADGFADMKLPEFQPFSFRVGVGMDGWAQVWAGWNGDGSVLPRPPKILRIQLEKGVSIGGRVEDEDGRPVAGAELLVEVYAKKPGPLYFGDRIARTGPDGSWQIENVPANAKSISLQIQHPDFVSDASTLERGHDGASLAEFYNKTNVEEVRKGMLLAGRVTDSSGKPVPGVQLWLGNGASRVGHALQPETDAKGHYEFPHCTGGEKMLTAYHADFAPKSLQFEFRSDNLNRDIRLEKGAKIRFRVVDADNNPLPGVQVLRDRMRSGQRLAYAMARLGWDYPTTDKDGIWKWEHSPAVPMRYTFQQHGRMILFMREYASGSETHKVTLYPKTVVSGRVIDDSTEEPVKSFRVTPGTASTSRPPASWNRYDTFSSADGEFKYVADHYREERLLLVEAAGYRPARSRVIKADEGKASLEFRLKRSATISGTVLQPDGSPAVNALVVLGTLADRVDYRSDSELDSDLHPYQLRTKDDGEFEFDKPGVPFTLFVFGEEGFAKVDGKEFDGNARPVTLTPYARIEGKLRIPPPHTSEVNIHVDFRGEHGGQAFFGKHAYFNFMATTDSEGTFSLEKVPAELDLTIYQTVEVRHGQYMSVGRGDSFQLTTWPGETHRITLGKKGVTVRGQLGNHELLASSCFELGNFQSADRKNGFQSGRAMVSTHFRVDENRNFEIPNVPPGTYHLEMAARDQPMSHPGSSSVLGAFSKTLVIKEGNRKDIDLGVLEFTPNPTPRIRAWKVSD